MKRVQWVCTNATPIFNKPCMLIWPWQGARDGPEGEGWRRHRSTHPRLPGGAGLRRVPGRRSVGG